MQRHMLRLTLVLGVLVTILGGTGVFAVFTDRANTGPNSVASGPRLTAADLKIATGDIQPDFVECGTFEDHSTTPGVQATDVQPGTQAGRFGVCLQNAGDAALAVTVGAPNLVDRETDCTGDEAASGDETCGGAQPGELSPLLEVEVREVFCDLGDPGQSLRANLAGIRSQPAALWAPIEPGATLCLEVTVGYSSEAPAAAVQVAQTDLAAWNFTFEGTAS